MQKNFEIYRTKIKGSCQSGRKVVTHDSKSDLPLKMLKTKIQMKANSPLDQQGQKFKSGSDLTSA